MALTRLAWIKEFLGITGTDSDAKLTTLIAQVSDQILKYLNRELELLERTEEIYGNDSKELFLPEYPIAFISRVYSDLETVGEITYSGTGNLPTVAVDDGILYLFYFDTAGVKQEVSITLSSFATLTLLSTEVATNSGWTFTVSTDRDSYPTSEIIDVGSGDSDNPTTFDIKSPKDYVAVRVVPQTNNVIRRVDDLKFLAKTYYVTYKAGYTLPSDEGGGEDGNLPDGLVLAVNTVLGDVFKESQAPGSFESEKMGDYMYKRSSSNTSNGSLVRDSILRNASLLQPYVSVYV